MIFDSDFRLLLSPVSELILIQKRSPGLRKSLVLVRTGSDPEANRKLEQKTIRTKKVASILAEDLLDLKSIQKVITPKRTKRFPK